MLLSNSMTEKRENQTGFVHFFNISKKMFINLNVFSSSVFIPLEFLWLERCPQGRRKQRTCENWNFFCLSQITNYSHRQYYIQCIILWYKLVVRLVRIYLIEKWCDLFSRRYSLPWRWNNKVRTLRLVTAIIWFHAEHLHLSRKIRKKVKQWFSTFFNSFGPVK